MKTLACNRQVIFPYGDCRPTMLQSYEIMDSTDVMQVVVLSHQAILSHEDLWAEGSPMDDFCPYRLVN